MPTRRARRSWSKRAAGVKCARSWRYFDPATADPEFPDVTPRDAKALREWRARAGVKPRGLGLALAALALALDQASKYRHRARLRGGRAARRRRWRRSSIWRCATIAASRSACCAQDGALGAALLTGFSLGVVAACSRSGCGARRSPLTAAGLGAHHRRRARQRGGPRRPMARSSISSTCTRSAGISSCSTSPTPRSAPASRC